MNYFAVVFDGAVAGTRIESDLLKALDQSGGRVTACDTNPQTGVKTCFLEDPKNKLANHFGFLASNGGNKGGAKLEHSTPSSDNPIHRLIVPGGPIVPVKGILNVGPKQPF